MMSINSNRKWTDDDERSLAELKAAGKSNLVVANSLRRTVAAVEQHLRILKDRVKQREALPSHG